MSQMNQPDAPTATRHAMTTSAIVRQPGAGPGAGVCAEGDHVLGAGSEHEAGADAGRREVVGWRADGCLPPYLSCGRIETVQLAVLPDRPDQATGHDRRSAAHPGTPQHVQRRWRAGGLYGDDAAEARQV